MRKKAFNVLSIDFDYWYCGFDNYDIGCCGFCEKEYGFEKHQYGFSRSSKPSQDSAAFVTEAMLVKKIPKDSLVFVAESHANIIGIIEKYRRINRYPRIFNFDFHDDGAPVENPLVLESEYFTEKPIITCGNWASYVVNNLGGSYFHTGPSGPYWMEPFRRDLPKKLSSAEYSLLSPNEQPVGLNPKGLTAVEILKWVPKPHLVFICKSSIYTYSASDKYWKRFLSMIGDYTSRNPIFIGHHKERLRNQYKKYTKGSLRERSPVIIVDRPSGAPSKFLV